MAKIRNMEIYTGEKVYVSPSGAIYDKARTLIEFPGALTFPYVVTTDASGEAIIGMDKLSTLCEMHDVEYTSDREDTLSRLINKMYEDEVAAEEAATREAEEEAAAKAEALATQ